MVANEYADVWALRHAVSVCDAAYVALAQRLDCGLLTLDRRLVAAAPRGVAMTVTPRTPLSVTTRSR